jgi:hypothetical protein
MVYFKRVLVCLSAKNRTELRPGCNYKRGIVLQVKPNSIYWNSICAYDFVSELKHFCLIDSP